MQASSKIRFSSSTDRPIRVHGGIFIVSAFLMSLAWLPSYILRESKFLLDKTSIFRNPTRLHFVQVRGAGE